MTQWFSSGKITRRVGTPRLVQSGLVQSLFESIKYLLLQGVEGADALGLRQPVIFATMDDELGRRPVIDKFHGVESGQT